MSTHSKDGREWAKLSELKPGMTVQMDDGFTCGIAGKQCLVGAAPDGSLFVNCKDGRHDLSSQADGGDGDHLVGVWRN